MKITRNWLEKHINKHLSIDDIYKALEDLSIEVDDEIKIGGEGYFVVKIVSIIPHGDRLKICTVEYSLNEQTIKKEIICGANNLEIDAYGIMAIEGVTLPSGVKLKERTICGFKSQGMLLSYEEFGLKHHKTDGIIISHERTFLDFLVKEDFILTISLPANRIDISSCRGLAEEISSYFHIETRNIFLSSHSPLTNQTSVNIQVNMNAVLNFSHVFIDNITINNSYWEMLALLVKIISISLLPIINISNFIMLDLGTPIHIYDRDNIENLKIDFLKEDEDFFTLQEETIFLKKGDIVVKDQNNKTLVVAGIIGGQEAKCSGKTKNIIVEAAIFNPVNFIPISRRLNLSTLSSYYFSRGINYSHYLICLQYLREFISGDWSKLHMLNGFSLQNKKIFVSFNRFYKLSKIAISLEEMAKLLVQYKYTVRIINQKQDTLNNEMGLEVTPPLWKNHIDSAASVIEDIIRIGQLKIPKEKLLIEGKLTNNLFYDALNTLRFHAISRNFKEVMTYTFVKNGSLELTNPIVQQEKYFRSDLQEHIISHLNLMYEEKLAINFHDKIFEISKVFYDSSGNDIKENTNIIFGLLRNSHHFLAAPVELQIKNLLGEIEDLFKIRIQLKEKEDNANSMSVYINNTANGHINFYSNYITCELYNLESYLNKKSTINEYLAKDFKKEEFILRDYSFTTDSNYEDIQKSLNKISNIHYSLFDIFKDSYGIRIKYIDVNPAKEMEVLNVLNSFKVVFR
jgi:phenylalanyl-tRNA synthetase beta chain